MGWPEHVAWTKREILTGKKDHLKQLGEDVRPLLKMIKEKSWISGLDSSG
jgi:hypothetical protein